MLRLAIDTHLITSHFALALLIRRPGGLVVEMTDGTLEYNAARTTGSRPSMTSPRRRSLRLASRRAKELAPHGCTALALTPGLDALGDDALPSTRVTEVDLARSDSSAARTLSRSPRPPRFVGAAPAPPWRPTPSLPRSQRRLSFSSRRAGARLRVHRPRRLTARLLALHGRGPGSRGSPPDPDRLPLRLRRRASACPPSIQISQRPESESRSPRKR